MLINNLSRWYCSAKMFRIERFQAFVSRNLSLSLGLCFLALMCFGGCATFSTEKGVESLWRSPETPVFVKGVTTESDVLAALGPPSQIISVNEGIAYYYLREEGRGSARIFIIYNSVNVKTTYDRAIFFFDAEGVLTDQAYSRENSNPSSK